MGRMNQVLTIASVAIVGWMNISSPTQAQVSNQSDTSGTNVFNNPAPQFGSGGQVNPAIVNTATQTSQELRSSQEAFNAAQQAAAQVTRRFASGTADQVCENPASARLNQAVDAARAFLERLNGEPAQPASNPASRIW